MSATLPASAPIEPPAAPGSLHRWILALRPKTLSAAIVPVAVGTAVAAREGGARALPAAAALAGALLIQVGTNLANDYYDFVKGADTSERVGPTRVTQSGLIAPKAVKGGALASFVAAAWVGAYLIAVGGWPIAAIGAASILAGYAYTGGPFPLGYHGLGDLFVFAFFGVVAVAGTTYAEMLRVPPLAWLASIAVGALSTAILAVNNLRDRETDARAGKRTLAVRLGETAVRWEYTLLIAAAFAVPVAAAATGLAGKGALLALLALPLALPPLGLVWRERGAPLNAGLAQTARLEIAFGILLVVGLLA